MSTHGIPLPEILEAVEVARERGWKIEPQYWIDRAFGQNVCCPLGACVIQRDMSARPDREEDAESIAKTLGIDASWAEGFADGFDGNQPRPSLKAVLSVYSEGHAAGTAARAVISVAELDEEDGVES